MAHFITPVVIDVDSPEGNTRTFTIIPDYIESEKLFPGTYEILEGELSHGHIAFDDDQENWEHTDMQNVSYEEIEKLASFIKYHEDADLDGVDF